MLSSLYLSPARAAALSAVLGLFVSTVPGQSTTADPVSDAPALQPTFGNGVSRTVIRPRASFELALDVRNFWQDRLIVKFAEHVRARRTARTDGERSTLAVTDRHGSSALLPTSAAALRTRKTEPVFSRPVGELERERRSIRKTRPDADLADLANFHRVYTTGRADTLRTLARLLRDPVVETAYPEFHPRAYAPAQSTRYNENHAPIRTPLFEKRQGYLAAGPTGIGMLPAQGLLGAQGHPKQKLVQIEGAWSLSHEDLPHLNATKVLGPKKWGRWNTRNWRDHGTAAVGILNAARNERGIRGIVPNSSVYVSSVSDGRADAISRATKVATRGDVFTSSLVLAVVLKSRGFHAPLDLPQDVYDAIRIAVAKGIVVTLAAGNTGNDLANTNLYGARYVNNATPSGAWLCGATFQGLRKKVGWSNYGDVVRFSSWGAGVTATAYGQLFRDPSKPEVRDYTHVFGGTSAAAPQVAGAAAAVQSTMWMTLRRTLDVDRLGRAMTRHGTSVTGRVGPRPDIFATLHGLGLVDGLRLENEVPPGGTLRVRLELRPNERFVLMGSTGNILAPLSGFSFPVVIDPSAIVTLDTGTMPKATPFELRLPIPRIESLGGQRLTYQAYRIDPKTLNHDMTNAVQAWFRRAR